MSAGADCTAPPSGDGSGAATVEVPRHMWLSGQTLLLLQLRVAAHHAATRSHNGRRAGRGEESLVNRMGGGEPSPARKKSDLQIYTRAHTLQVQWFLLRETETIKIL